MSDTDTGIGSSVSSRTIVRFTTTTTSFPASTQVIASPPDTGTSTAPTARNDVWDEAGRPVTVSATGSSFTTSAGGPA